MILLLILIKEEIRGYATFGFINGFIDLRTKVEE